MASGKSETKIIDIPENNLIHKYFSGMDNEESNQGNKGYKRKEI